MKTANLSLLTSLLLMHCTEYLALVDKVLLVPHAFFLSKPEFPSHDVLNVRVRRSLSQLPISLVPFCTSEYSESLEYLPVQTDLKRSA